MKLFLTSAGLPPETTEAFLKLLDKKPEETRVYFIPTASYGNHPEGNAWYVKADKQRLVDLGFKTISEADLRNENEKSLNDKLKNFDVVFVGGGNTFYLLKYVQESGFENALKSFLERGGVYVGASAGSIIACPDISPCGWSPDWDENKVSLQDFRGMGLVDFVIIPHYEPNSEKIILENKSKISWPIIAPTNEQAVLVDGEKVEFVGPGEFKKFE